MLVGALRAFSLSDPPLVGYITYLPGYAISHIAVDQAGYLYFPGVRDSPCTLPAQSPLADDNVYGSIAKLQPGGDGIVWTACLPGAVGGLAVDASGSIYLANNSNGATTVTKLTADASKTIYSSSIAAAASSSIAVDPAGNIYITGAATPGLPTTPGAAQPSLNCGTSGSACKGGFAVKLSPAGAVQYATYLGALRTQLPSTAAARLGSPAQGLSHTGPTVLSSS
jgi:DNA-binding beta-propeller fold protein YncE